MVSPVSSAQIVGLVPFQQEFVEVQGDQGLVVPDEPDIAHRALLGGSACHIKRIGDRGKRADRISSRLYRLANHEDLDGMQIPHGHLQIELLEILRQMLPDLRFSLRKSEA